MTTSTDRARAAMGMSSQATSRPAGTELTSVDKRIAECRAMEQAFADAVAQGLSPQMLIRDAITAVRSVPELANTTKESFFGSLMTAAQLGLRPNVASLGHGWVLPRRNKRKGVVEAHWELGYQGMVELGYRSRLVEKITAHTIYEGEPHRLAWGTTDTLEHEPLQDPNQRGDMLWHYAVVWLRTGGVLWNAIPEGEAQATMRTFVQGSGSYGPWRDNYLPMARKTALRGLWRWMPKTPELSMAMATDGVVREGMDRDPALVVEPEGEPERPTVTITREPPPDPEPADQAQGEQPTDAEVVPEQPTQPAEHIDGAGVVRELQPETKARQAYYERITSTQHQRTEATIEAAIGWPVPLQYLSTAELRRVQDYRWGDE